MWSEPCARALLPDPRRKRARRPCRIATNTIERGVWCALKVTPVRRGRPSCIRLRSAPPTKPELFLHRLRRLPQLRARCAGTRRRRTLNPCYTESVYGLGELNLNLTIVVDNDTLKRARIRAIRENTSVNAVVRQYLEAYAGTGSQRTRACGRLLALSNSSTSRRGGAVWTRDDLHER